MVSVPKKPGLPTNSPHNLWWRFWQTVCCLSVHNSKWAHLQNFSDAVVGFKSGGWEVDYRALVTDFVEWSRKNCLLNVAKTREMVIDFRVKRMATQLLNIRGEDAEVVEDYKYLSGHIDCKLWKKNTKAVYKKGMSRLPRKLRSFGTCSRMLDIFYQSVVASTLGCSLLGKQHWRNNPKRLNKLIRKAGSVIGYKPETMEAVVKRRMLNKLISILDNPDHPLHPLLDRQRSSFSNRPIQRRCHKDIFPAQCYSTPPCHSYRLFLVAGIIWPSSLLQGTAFSLLKRRTRPCGRLSTIRGLNDIAVKNRYPRCSCFSRGQWSSRSWTTKRLPPSPHLRGSWAGDSRATNSACVPPPQAPRGHSFRIEAPLFLRLLEGKAVGATPSLCSGFHPQPNGQTERVNQDPKTALHCPRESRFKVLRCSMAGVSHNSSATGTSPYQCVYGYQPPPFLSTSGSVSCPSALDFSPRQCRGMWTQAWTNLLWTVSRFTTQANCRRTPTSIYQVEQRVWLSIQGPSSPRRIQRVISQMAVSLRLPRTTWVHPIFHVSRVKATRALWPRLTPSSVSPALHSWLTTPVSYQ